MTESINMTQCWLSTYELSQPQMEFGCPWAHVCKHRPEAIYCQPCLRRSQSWMKLQFSKCRLHVPVFGMFYQSFLHFSFAFFHSPRLNFSHRYQCLVTTVHYGGRPADLMKINGQASPANADTNIFPRWKNGKSVICNACCWAGTARSQLSVWLVIQLNKSWHRWSEPTMFKFYWGPLKAYARHIKQRSDVTEILTGARRGKMREEGQNSGCVHANQRHEHTHASSILFMHSQATDISTNKPQF